MLNKIFRKIEGKWIFLFLVFLLYLVLSIINFNLIERALSEALNLLWRIIPVFLLVFLFTLLLRLFFDSRKMLKFFGGGSRTKGWLFAILGGILSTGPIYMWYPLLSELKEKGMRDSFIATFLYNRAVKIPLLPMMIYYFGLPFTLALTFYMILFSIINGILVDKFLRLK